MFSKSQINCGSPEQNNNEWGGINKKKKPSQIPSLVLTNIRGDRCVFLFLAQEIEEIDLRWR